MSLDPGPLMIDLAGSGLEADEAELLSHPAVGGVILFTRNYRDPEELAALCGRIRDVRPGLLIAADYEGGRVQRFREGFTGLPSMRALGRLHDRDASAATSAAEACGLVIGAELGAVGVDLPLTPVLDLDYGVSAVIGDRALHGEPAVVADLARALRHGLQAAGVATTGKHFPGHGGVAPDSHAELPVDGRDLDGLERDLAPFRELCADGLESVMMAHIRYPAVDDSPASLSPIWIGRILRKHLGFEGAVFCDDLSMGGAAAIGDYPARARAALRAGCDILPVCNNRQAVEALLSDLPPESDAISVHRRAGLRRRASDLSPRRLDAARSLVTSLT